MCDRKEFAKYERKHPREFAACFANLQRVCDLLNTGMKLRSFDVGFLRNERGDLYRVAQSGVSHAAETRLYIFPHEGQHVIYVLGIRGKARQPQDIIAFTRMIDTIKEQQ